MVEIDKIYKVAYTHRYDIIKIISKNHINEEVYTVELLYTSDDTNPTIHSYHLHNHNITELKGYNTPLWKVLND